MAVARTPTGTVDSQPTFAQLVSLACHDLRTPLATASGFAHTLQRLDTLEPPADRYVEMIGAASQQMGALLDMLGVAARIESGRYDPNLQRQTTREVADAAAAQLEVPATVSGDGSEVAIDPNWTAAAVAALAECVRRHGALESATLGVDGATISIGPLAEGVASIALGEDLKDFGAAVAVRVLRAHGATVTADGDAVLVVLSS